MMREIIKIDEELCTGCGQCIPNCPEGALQIIDGKARMVSDLFCDGLGACIGHCPEGALSVEVREAEIYDERKVMENIVKQGVNVTKAHLKHLRDHNQNKYYQEAVQFLKERKITIPTITSEEAALPCGCPGSAVRDLREEYVKDTELPRISQLSHWPVQLMLVPVNAPFLEDADLLIASDCVPCACPNFHNDLLKDKILLVGCPKFDNIEFYREKLTEILKQNNIKSVTTAIMEVPCCFGLYKLVSDAVEESKSEIPLKKFIVDIKGDLKLG